MSERERVLQRFVRLCEIPSPTGSERAVADAVASELRELGVEVSEDGTAEAAQAGAGNLHALVPGRSEAFVAFSAHLDTVPHEGPIAVVGEDGTFRSAGETILGADDKAAIAVLVELAARHVREPGPVGIELLLTVAEEDGLRGAKAFDVSTLRAPFGFVLDHASPIGEILVAAPTYKRLTAEFQGTEAHAGLRPEAGHSAIEAAAAAIAGMELGRIDEQTTANVGLISGGTATNVVPGRCRVEGEARSLDPKRAAEVVGEMLDACTWAAAEHQCDVDVATDEVFGAYRVPDDAAPLRIAREALARCGHQPRELETGGGSDVNALRAAGFDCILLANGTEANHTPEESVSESAILEMLAVCEAILEESAGRIAGPREAG